MGIASKSSFPRVIQEGHLLDKADEELSKFLSLPKRVFGSPLYDTVCTDR